MGYCSVSDVERVLGLSSGYFTDTSTPSYTDVENLIEFYSDYIDRFVGFAWREKRANDGRYEYHTVGRIQPRGCLLPRTRVWFNSRPEVVEYSLHSFCHVVSANGSTEKVLRSEEIDYQNGEAFIIKPKLLQEFAVTSEHPFYIVRYKTRYDGEIATKRAREDYIKIYEGWVSARNLREGDFLVIPKVKDSAEYVKVMDSVVVDEQFARFLGWFVAEGNIRNNGVVVLSLNTEEAINDVTDVLEKLGCKFNVIKENNSTKISFSSSLLAEWLKENCGSVESKRRVPSCIFSSPESVRKEFLRAVILGDGWIREDVIGVGTVCEDLWYDLTFLFVSVGVIPMVTKMKVKDKRTLKERCCVYQLLIYGKQRAKLFDVDVSNDSHQRFIEEEDRFLIPIKKIEKIPYSGKIYNIVTESHTYAIPFITHNSWFIWLGYPIYLRYRKVRQFDKSKGDALEFFNGREWVDFLTNRREGLDGDYWVDYDDGIIYFRGLWAYLGLREFAVRVKYRYGDETPPEEIKLACSLLVASHLLTVSDRLFLLPEGGTGVVNASEKIERFKEQAFLILERWREFFIPGS